MSAGTMAGQMKRRNLPRRGMAIVGILAVLALGFFGYTRFFAAAQQPSQPAPAASAPALSVRTARVASGPISSALSASADVRPASQVSVVPKASGRIEALSVDVGSRVKRGEVIARLDSAAIAAQVSQARANLAAAQARLSALTAGPRSEQVAQAQAALDTAMARRDQVERGANDAQRTAAAKAVEGARATLASAEASVLAARAGLDALKAWPTQREWGSAFAAADTARANVKAAEEKLADVRAGAKPAELLAATQAVEASRASLMAKEDGLQVARDNGTPLTTWGATGTSLGQSQESLVASRTAYEAAKANLALLQSRPLPWELQAAESNLEAAKASLSAATAAVEQMKRGATAEDLTKASAQVTSAENSVLSARASLATAEANERQIVEGATAEERRIAEAAVVQASEALKLAANPYRASDFEQAKAGVMQAQAALEAAEIALAEASVVSPVDGVVAERAQSVGQLVGPSSPIVTIVSSEVELSLGVEEAQVGSVAEGQRAEITVAAYPGEVFPARVSLIAPTADARSRTFTVKVRPEVSDGRLRSGMFASVKILTAEKAGAVLLPKEALVTKGGATSVFVLSGETVSQRAVKTGLTSGGVVEVLSGVASGEEVVVAGAAELRDGDKVKRG